MGSSTGNDILFTSSDGTTKIPHEVEKYTSSTGELVAWVKVPSLATSSDSYFYMYYGSANAPNQQEATSTWDSNYKGVWHLDETSTTTLDSTTNGNTGTSTGTGVPSSISGPAATGRTFDGNDDRIGILDSTSLRPSSAFTISFWGRRNGASQQWGCMIDKVQDPAAEYYSYAVCQDSNSAGQFRGAISAGGSYVYTTTTSALSDLTWYYFVFRWDNSRGGGEAFLDVYNANGTLNQSVNDAFKTGTMDYTTRPLYFAEDEAADNYSGSLDEVRISDIERSSGWIQTELNNQSNPATFETFGNEESAPSIPAQGTPFRLRMLLHVGTASLSQSGQTFNLQVAAKGTSTLCASPGGSSSTYANVSTSSGVIRFYDNPAPANAALLMASSGDPGHLGHTISSQAYTEQNTWTNNIAAIPAGDDGLWDFSLVDNSAPTSTIYCFRAVKSDGSSLDVYDHYPEVKTASTTAANSAPVVSSVLLNNGSDITVIENTSTSISVTATAQDADTYSNLSYATSVIYRSGATAACTADQNNCYRISSSSCSLSACAGNSCTVTCTAKIQYFAESTDDAGAFTQEDWQASVTAVDAGDLSNTSGTLSGVELNSLLSLDVTPTIAYGTLRAGLDSTSTNQVATTTNTGNVAIDIDVSGTNMTSSSYSISIANQKFASSSFTYASCTICTIASTTATTTDLNLYKPTSTVAVSTPTYWGLLVPTGTPPFVYTGANTFSAAAQVNVGKNWAPVAAAPWAGRKSSVVLQYKQKLWIMSGYTATATTNGTNDVWYTSDGVTWTQATSAAAWETRYSATGVVYDEKMWIMGGTGCAATTQCPDVWWSTDGVTWTQATSTANWGKRESPRAVVFNGKMWVFGGYNGSILGDIWYSTTGVSWVSTTSPVGARYYGQMLVYGGKIWIIGGYKSVGGDSNDVWWSADGATWTQATSAAAWSTRWQVNGTVFNNRMWIMGGYRTSPAGYVGDVWSSQDGVTWTNVPQGIATTTFKADSPFVPFNDSIYSVGGDASGTMTAQIRRTNP
jgi:hypothetical protein